MRHYVLNPEVPGGLGPRTVLDRVPGRPTHVDHLHIVFEGWLGDALLEITPSFLVTSELGRAMESAELTGMQLADVDVSTGEQFDEQAERALPTFRWLKVTGQPCRDDLGLTEGLQIVVSERALQLIRGAGLSHAEVSEFQRN